mmetsp:Transcript_8236/g.22682  ORF Transcript_8236/g.22682 Transcript_8236/m.22682 type:complete len:218 (+) Transcript_8236:1970-2623(+)
MSSPRTFSSRPMARSRLATWAWPWRPMSGRSRRGMPCTLLRSCSKALPRHHVTCFPSASSATSSPLACSSPPKPPLARMPGTACARESSPSHQTCNGLPCSRILSRAVQLPIQCRGQVRVYSLPPPSHTGMGRQLWRTMRPWGLTARMRLRLMRSCSRERKGLRMPCRCPHTTPFRPTVYLRLQRWRGRRPRRLRPTWPEWLVSTPAETRWGMGGSA